MAIGIMIMALSLYFAGVDESMIKINPEEIDDLMANPGMGWQTFHHFADEDKNLEGLPSSSAYFRFYWSQIEPEEGKIDFEMLDGLLNQAKKAGQKLAFRVMCAGTSRDYMYVPQWLKDKGCKGYEYKYEGSNILHWVPDMDDPIFKEAHFRLIKELGERYDGHPDIDLLDMGSVGLWGEWHMSGTGVDVPTLETRIAIIDAYIKAFPKTPKVMLIGDLEGMKHAIKNGCGWRADCMGDMGGFSKNWSHMKNMYPQQVEKTGASEVWKTAPVAFETCWDMRKWKEEGWDIRYIFDYALNFHASYLNNKSAKIPEGTREEVERFIRRMGYRLVLRQLEHKKIVSTGHPLSISMIWENVGVAPPYRDYILALRLMQGQEKYMVISNSSVKGWLPGEIKVSEAFNLPSNIKADIYQMAIGVVDPATKAPAINLAIEGRTDDGWYPVSQVEIR